MSYDSNESLAIPSGRQADKTAMMKKLNEALNMRRPPCKPNTSKLTRKIQKLEWKFEQAIKTSRKATATRIMKSYENLVRKPQYVIAPGFRPRKVKLKTN